MIGLKRKTEEISNLKRAKNKPEVALEWSLKWTLEEGFVMPSFTSCGNFSYFTHASFPVPLIKSIVNAFMHNCNLDFIHASKTVSIRRSTKMDAKWILVLVVAQFFAFGSSQSQDEILVMSDEEFEMENQDLRN